MTFETFKTNAITLADEGGLTGKERATFLLSALQTFIQVDAEAENNAARIAAEESMNAARIAAEESMNAARIAADAGVKTAQIALLNSQKASEIARMAVSYQQELGEKIKNGGVSISHTYDADGNVLTTTYGTGTSKSIYESQRDLQERQRIGFDDKRRSDAAQHAAGVVGMIYASGANPPSDAYTWVKTLADNVATPPA